MATGFQKVRSSRQWLKDSLVQSVTASIPTQIYPVAVDLEEQWSIGGHVLRLIGGYGVSLSNGTAGAVNSVLGVGLVRMERDLAEDVSSLVTSALIGEDADMPWLFWRAWPLRIQLTSTTGLVHLEYGDGNLLDWQMRAGKGTYLDKDTGIYWVISQFGLTEGSCTFYCNYKLLVSSP